MSLGAFPNEILGEIFQYCKEPSSPGHFVLENDLCSLCLCSKRIRAAAEPILYSSFYEFRSVQLLKFLRSVLHRPELAQHVTRLEVQLNFTSHTLTSNTKLLDFDRSPDLGGKLQAAFNSFEYHHSSHTRLYHNVQTGYGDAAAATLLTLLPRLNHLSIYVQADNDSAGHCNNYDYISRVLRLISEQNPPNPFLQQLKSLEVKPVGEILEIRMSDWDRHISPFCKLESVKKLVLEAWELSAWHWTMRSGLKLPSVDVALRLHRVNVEKFKEFISCFPKLQRFSFEKPKASPLSLPESHPLNQVIQSLVQVKSSLKYLWLRCPKHGRLLDFPCNDVQSLAGFQSLEVLDVLAFDNWIDATEPVGPTGLDFKFKPLADILPSGIKHLFLRRGSRRTIIHALGLLEVKQERVPSLEVLKITLDIDEGYSGTQTAKDEVENLREMGVKCGVVVEVEECSGEEARPWPQENDLMLTIRRGHAQRLIV